MPPEWCKTEITRAQGCAPDATGVVRLRTVGFRAFCPACGYLGATKSYHGAKYDARKHRMAVAA